MASNARCWAVSLLVGAPRSKTKEAASSRLCDYVGRLFDGGGEARKSTLFLE
jgi:hypothetical protein